MVRWWVLRLGGWVTGVGSTSELRWWEFGFTLPSFAPSVAIRCAMLGIESPASPPLAASTVAMSWLTIRSWGEVGMAGIARMVGMAGWANGERVRLQTTRAGWRRWATWQ